MTKKRSLSTGSLIFLAWLALGSPAGAQQSTESALRNLKAADKSLRQQSAADLGVLGKSDVVGPLDEAFRSEGEADVRGEILLSLGKIRDKAALSTLTYALANDPAKDVRLQAIDSILRLYIPIEEQGVVRRFLGGVKSLFVENEQLVVQPFVQVDKEAKESLSKALLDRESAVRENAARALGSLRAGDQVAAMDQALAVSGKDTRVAIVRALGIIRSEEAGPVLLRQLNDREKDVVRQSAISLGLVKYGPGQESLKKLFHSSKDKDLRRAGAEGMALISDPKEKEFFEGLLRDDRDDKLREFGAEGLARIADASSEQLLRERLNRETKSNVTTALHFALVSLGKTEHVGPLVSAVTARFSNQAEVYLFEIGKHQKRIDLLYPFLLNDDPKVRAAIVRVLGRIGNYEAFERIQPLASDKNEDVAKEAVEAMRILERSRR
ncbi:MAG: HEAT repeat domain-containing protein [Acidobacteriota bacterium]